jgi:hypothetical protein
MLAAPGRRRWSSTDERRSGASGAWPSAFLSLNIKNPETSRLIREQAEARGESLTEAVTMAVRERLRRVRTDFDVVEILEWVARSPRICRLTSSTSTTTNCSTTTSWACATVSENWAARR